LTENVAFLTDFDPNLMVFDMDGLAYAVVDNSQKRGTGNGERGTENMGTPVHRGKGGNREPGTGNRNPARGGRAGEQAPKKASETFSPQVP
jgi:hypothetical protein